MLAVGNVGEELAPYSDSDIFITRDGGFSWEEIHKDAHMWEFGDSGSVIVIVNDEDVTDQVLYSTDEGLSWKSHNFGTTLRVQSIQTVPDDTSRRFLLIGYRYNEPEKSVLVHLDFSAITSRKCKLLVVCSSAQITDHLGVWLPDDPNNDDFELWSPSEGRDETCLFGRQTKYRRKIRDKDCYIGARVEQPKPVVRNCTCTASDFEW